MKLSVSVVLLLAVMLSACAAPFAASPTQTPAPTVAPTAVSTATTSAASAVASSSDHSCGPGACVRRAIVQNDGTRLIFLFDLDGAGHSIDQENPPQFMGNLVIGSYYLKADGSEDFLVGGKLAPEKYFCYGGNDLPWTGGQFGAVCGFSIPLDEMQTYKPQVGDQVRVELPYYSNFKQTVTVEQAEPDTPEASPTP